MPNRKMVMNLFDFDVNHHSEQFKAALNGVPFLAGVVKDLPTPYYTKLLQAVITALLIAMCIWAGNLLIGSFETNKKLELIEQFIKNETTNIKVAVENDREEIKALKVLVSTENKVTRPEWIEKDREQDGRILQLERALK